jgi:uncharacterized protein (TIGR02147 family)
MNEIEVGRDKSAYVVEYLNQEFKRRCEKNVRYSVRAFARALRIDQSTLSALLRGKRPLTAKTAKRILDQLDINPIEKNKLLVSVIEMQSGVAFLTEYETIDENVFRIISGWEHFAILALSQTINFKSSPSWIANYLGLTHQEVVDALERLESAKLIERRDGSITNVRKNLTTTNDIPSSAVRLANKQYLERAIYSLENHDVSERDITGITMAISRKRLNDAKELIKRFRRELSDLLEESSADEVYRLNIQLFPLKG